jgi:hypothetical protein
MDGRHPKGRMRNKEFLRIVVTALAKLAGASRRKLAR